LLLNYTQALANDLIMNPVSTESANSINEMTVKELLSLYEQVLRQENRTNQVSKSEKQSDADELIISNSAAIWNIIEAAAIRLQLTDHVRQEQHRILMLEE
jgi:hypothetical protein